MKRIYMNEPDSLACGFYRAVLPVQHCQKDLAKEGIELTGSATLNHAEKFDAYIFHRIPNSRAKTFLRSLKGKAKLVWEVDDALDLLPKWNPASKRITKENLADLNWALDLADMILVTTEELRQHLKRQDKTVVTPNLIDPALFFRSPIPDRPKPVVLWAGSLHHRKDIDQLAPVVNSLRSADWVFFGDKPKGAKGITYLKGDELRYYFPTLRGIAPDIALCPLVDEPFNYYKSGLKFLEMAASGACVIASKLPPYGMIEDNLTGLLTEDWKKTIAMAIEMEEFRKGIAANGRKRVLANHSWNGPGKELWLNAFRQMV